MDRRLSTPRVRTAEERDELAESIVAAWPPFTDEQRAVLRPILSGSLPLSPAPAGPLGRAPRDSGRPLPPHAIEMARAIAESAPPVSAAQIARLRLLMWGPEVPATAPRPEPVTRTRHDEIKLEARMATVEPMSMEELLALPVSFGIRTAARALGLGQRKAYELAAAGEFPCPVRRDGQEYRVTRPDLFRHLGLDPAMVAAPARDGKELEAAPPSTCRAHCPFGDSAWALFHEAILAAAKVLAEGASSGP